MGKVVRTESVEAFFRLSRDLDGAAERTHAVISRAWDGSQTFWLGDDQDADAYSVPDPAYLAVVEKVRAADALLREASHDAIMVAVTSKMWNCEERDDDDAERSGG